MENNYWKSQAPLPLTLSRGRPSACPCPHAGRLQKKQVAAGARGEAFLTPAIPHATSPTSQPLWGPWQTSLTFQSLLHRIQLRDPGWADDHRKQPILKLHLNAWRKTRSLKLNARYHQGTFSITAHRMEDPFTAVTCPLGISGLEGAEDKMWDKVQFPHYQPWKLSSSSSQKKKKNRIQMRRTWTPMCAYACVCVCVWQQYYKTQGIKISQEPF